MLGQLASEAEGPIRVGLHETGLVIAARHDKLDGLGLLKVAEAITTVPLRSTARGLGSTRDRAGIGALARRAWEVAFRPPALVAPSRAANEPGDSFALRCLDTSVRTAQLIQAGARAVVLWNHEHHRPARRISVAVGASRVGGTSVDLSDQSAFLRLTGVEHMDLETIRRQLAEAPAQPNSVPGTVSAVAGTLLRWAAPRLGSTLLVSHLGDIQTPGSAPLSPVALYPVTGGGSGVCLGAATVAGRTTLTLRSRAARHSDQDLEHLMELVLGALG